MRTPHCGIWDRSIYSSACVRDRLKLERFNCAHCASQWILKKLTWSLSKPLWVSQRSRRLMGSWWAIIQSIVLNGPPTVSRAHYKISIICKSRTIVLIQFESCQSKLQTLRRGQHFSFVVTYPLASDRQIVRSHNSRWTWPTLTNRVLWRF